MTESKKPRELAEEELNWLYVEGIPANSSYPSKAIPNTKLIELLDMRTSHKLLKADAEELAAALRWFEAGFSGMFGAPGIDPKDECWNSGAEMVAKALFKWREKYGGK